MASVNDILTTARSQIGTTEWPRGSNRQKYGVAYGFNGVQWCSIAVWWFFFQNGIDLKQRVAPGYAACATALAGYQRLGWVLSNKRDAQPADVVFFDFPGDGTNVTHHTGLVEINRGPFGLTCIEGNTSGAGSQTNGGAVMRKQRSWVLVKAVARVRILTDTPNPIPWPAPNPAPPTPATPATPINNEDDMRIFKVPGDKQNWLCAGNWERRWITDDHANKLRWYGVPYAEVDEATKWVVFAQWYKEIPSV